MPKLVAAGVLIAFVFGAAFASFPPEAIIHHPNPDLVDRVMMFLLGMCIAIMGEALAALLIWAVASLCVKNDWEN